MTAPISVNAANVASGFVAPLPFGRAHPWNGLHDGQQWNVPPGGPWQARLCPKGRAHVIGGWVASLRQNYDSRGRGVTLTLPPRPWHHGPAGFDRACRVAWLHERMVRRAKAVGNG